MATANHKPLSTLCRNPEVAAFFRRGEDGAGQFAEPKRPEPVLNGGVARVLEAA